MAMTKEERNAKRRERYAEQKQSRIDAKAGANALRNLESLDLSVRRDGFYSATTGAGIAGIDKFQSYSFSSDNESKLTDELLECLYLDNDVAATIVERVTRDALRGGYHLMWGDASEELRADVIGWAEERYDVTSTILRARVYSRLFGGGAILKGATGGSEGFRTPMPEDAGVAFIRPIPGKDLRATSWNADIVDQEYSTVLTYDYQLPSFKGVGSSGDPRAYVSSPTADQRTGTIVVDGSYIIPLYGILTTDDRFRDNDGWGDSVLRRVYDALLQFEAAYQSVLHTLAENSIPVYKVEGLLNMLASENADLLQARFQLLNAGKSNYRAIVLGENEEFLRVNAPLQEAANVVQSAMQRVSGAAGMPMTVIWGMSPAGMNATGKSDLEIWNQQVHKEQNLEVGPVILETYRYLLRDPESPLGGEVPDDLHIEFPSLWTPSLQDQVNNYAQVAGADIGYVTAGVLKPEQVAVDRAKEPNTLFPTVPLAQLEANLALDEDPGVVEEGAGEGSAAPVGSPEGLDTPEGSEPQKAALNGAQISGLVAIATTAAEGTLPLETAKAIAAASFPLSPETLEAIFAPLPASKFEEKEKEPDPVPPMNPLAGLGEPEPPAPNAPPMEMEDEE